MLFKPKISLRSFRHLREVAQPNGVTVMIEKLSVLPPEVHCIVSALSLVASFIFLAVLSDRGIGYLLLALAMCFAVFGFASMLRQARDRAFMSRCVNADLSSLTTPQIIRLISWMYRGQGFSFDPYIPRRRKEHAADYIAVKGKQRLFVRLRDWYAPFYPQCIKDLREDVEAEKWRKHTGVVFFSDEYDEDTRRLAETQGIALISGNEVRTELGKMLGTGA